MYKITHIDQLGTEYTVSDDSGVVIKSIQVVTHNDILEAALGPYTDEFKSMQEYIDKSIEVLEGFEEVDPTRVMWYATNEEEVQLSELIEYAIGNGYDKIILEHLEDLE